MTKTLTLRSIDVPQTLKFGIGFDSMLNELLRVTQHQTTNYPPHNVIKTGENTVVIELAVAGFSEGEIALTLDSRILVITGEKARAENIGWEYVHRGLSSRDFKTEFTLAEFVEVVSAGVCDGILTIHLERRIPEEMKPRQIAIQYNK